MHIAHIKALGADTAGMSSEIIDLIEAAQDNGQAVTADQYPWLASSTTLSAALIPPWANEGGANERLKRFDDPTARDRLRADIAENLRRRNGPEAILFVAGNPDRLGKTLAEVAETAQLDAVDATIALLREGDQLIANFNQTDDDVRAFMQRPWVGTSSDSSPGHPRAVGSFAEKYHEYVVAQKVISVGEFVRSSTSATADAFGIPERGRLQTGHFADVVIFDPDRFAATATYTDPTSLSEGVVLTMVNGEAVVENDTPLDIAAGRPLLHTPTAGICPDPPSTTSTTTTSPG